MKSRPIDLTGLAAIAANVVPELEKRGVSDLEILRFLTKAASKAGVPFNFVSDDGRTGEPEGFFSDWKKGLTPLPYGPARAVDLYKGYTAWCKAKKTTPTPMKKFAGAARQRFGALRWNCGVVFVVGDELATTAAIGTFAEAAAKYEEAV